MSRAGRSSATAGLIAIVAALSACGSSDPSSTSGSAHQGVKFAECMRRNGVGDFPDPGPSGSFTIDGIVNGSSVNPNTPAFKQALSTCEHLEPAGFIGTKRSPQQQQAALKFAQCMRQNGVPDFPDPTPNGPIIDTSRIPSAAGRGAHSIPGFTTAADKCSAIYSGELGLPRR